MTELALQAIVTLEGLRLGAWLHAHPDLFRAVVAVAVVPRDVILVVLGGTVGGLS